MERNSFPNLPRLIRVLSLVCMLLGTCALQLSAQQDAYHDFLKMQLDTGYGITGGTWVIDDNETGAINRIFVNERLDRENVSVSDMPFTQGVRLSNSDRDDPYFQYFAFFNSEEAPQTNDVCLAVLWVKGIEAERGFGAINTVYQMTEAPFTSYFFKDMGLSPEWQQWFIPFEVTDDLNNGWLTVRLGYMIQEIEIGGIAVLNYGQEYAVDELPTSTYDRDYFGREADAAWRAPAQERIEQHRMGNMQLNIKDADGNPVEGAGVAVNMIEHEFGFGTVVALNNWLNHPEKETYREKILDITGDGRTFNIAVMENAMKWPFWENDNWPGTRPETADLVETLSERGMRVRGHALLWPSYDLMPSDISDNSNDPEYVRGRILDHVDDIMNYGDFDGQVTEWDVLNEPAHLFDVQNIMGGTGFYGDLFQKAKQNNPDAKLYVNDYSILTRLGADLSTQDLYKEIINDIESNGGQIDGIGLQGHFKYPLTPPETIYEIIDEYAAGGKAISITEYDAEDVDEFMAGEYMRDFLTIVFSHPAVENFLMWGIWDPIHWRDDSPMFREDWSLKPSGTAFLDLVFDEWWTSEAGTTDSEGSFNVDGFRGTYVIEVDHNGSISNDTIVLSDSVQSFDIMLDRPTSVNETTAAGVELEQNVPNPAGEFTTVTFEIATSATVRLTLHDLNGNILQTVINEKLSSGRYSEVIDLTDLPSGLYIYRLNVDGNQRARRLSVMR